MKRLSTSSVGWNGTARSPFANRMSEPSGPHSEKLFSLARSLSGLGLDAANGIPSNLPGKDQDDDEEPPPPESGIELGPGLYFEDGRRKVDYVLCYKYKKRRESKPRLSVVSNGSIPPLVSGCQGSEAELGEAGLSAVEAEESKLTEEEKAVMRAEFETGLQEAGLNIERDTPKSWQAVAFIRLHIPWPTLSREAELQKIKVPVKKKYELRERTGIAGIWDSLMSKVSQPFQPDVPELDIQRDAQTRVCSKTLKHPFIRDKLQLYDIKSTETLFDNATRSRIVAEIISRTSTQTCQTTGITSLLARGVYDSAFSLHDGSFTRRGRRDQRNDRQILHEEWANYGAMHKYQPVDLIRKYFGEQIGLYFAWLGVYTQLLIPPSLLGIIVFVYGILTVDTNVPSQETCDDNLNITMCPLCNGVCDYWRLSSVCTLAKASYLFDNGATVLFAIFMSLWAACFLEHWKRRQMCLKHSWDLISLEDEEEELRPEYEAALQEKKEKIREKKKKKQAARPGENTEGERDKMLSTQREPESLDIEDHLSGYVINVATLLLLIGATFSAVFSVAIYRICMLTVWSMNPDPEAKASVRMTVTTTAIILNMLVVLVLEEVYGAFAVWLTELELPKTEAEFEERLIFKSFFLKSMNAFAPIFYVAFFKGRFAGRPGDYVYIFGDYRMEECAPPGCLIELCIQLSMIMLGKQLIQNNVFEVVIPKLKKMYRTMQEEKAKKLRAGRNEAGEQEPRRPKQQFDKDFALEPYEGVCPEYMEMIIQYGFVSLFVASFPLAPALALLNNVIEIRLDAAKFITEIRRPDAVRCKDIGIWYNILCGISKFSVITNAFVISFTSEFIPRMLYQYMYSVNGTMTGYTEHSLAYFNVSNFQPGSAPTSTLIKGVSMCRYKDYRDPPWAPDTYTFSKQYWSVLAARLAFVIFFQNLAMFLSMLVAWLIPDVPRSLREQLKKENMTLMEFLLNEEGTAKPGSPRHAAPCRPTNIDIVVEAPQQDEDVEDEEEEEEEHREEREKEEEQEEAWRKEEEERDEGEKEKKEEEGKKEEEVEAGVAVTRNSDSELETSTKGEVEDEEREREGDGDGEEKANDEIVRLADGRAVVEMEEQVAAEREDERGEGRPGEEKEKDSVVVEDDTVVLVKEEQHIYIDLDLFMDQLGLLDDGDDDGLSSSKAREMELPRSDSGPQYPHLSELPDSPDPAPEQGSSYSLSDRVASTWAVAPDPMLYSLIGPPPKDVGSRGKARCFTLPSRPRVSQASFSLPRVSLSSSLTKLQQMASSIPLVPLCTPVAHSQLDPYSPPRTPRSLTPLQPESPPTQPESPLPQPESALHQPESPPAQAESALHQPESPLPQPESALHEPESPPAQAEWLPARLESPVAQPESPLDQPESPKPHLSFELFKLKGPPAQEPRSRARSRCSTLPARQRGPGAEDRAVKPSQSASFTKQGDRIPPSPSELKRDSLL